MYVSVYNCFTFDWCVCKLDFGDGRLVMFVVVALKRGRVWFTTKMSLGYHGKQWCIWW